MPAIHQVLPVFAPRDAIGYHTVAIQRALRSMGIASEIIAGEINPGAPAPARSVREIGDRRHRLGRDDGPTWLLYHASTGSAVADWFATRPERKLIDYHNMSPHELIGPWEPHVGIELEHGRRQLAELADITEWALADSSYNERELAALGYRRTAVVPILVDTGNFVGNPDRATLDQLAARKRAEGGADWLFVSRLLPHKAQHDVIKAFSLYRRAYDGHARLTLVGAAGSARYADALADFVEDLGLTDAIALAGSVSPGVLEAHYRSADVYVALSDHEGFGVPLLEAMAHGVPVVAYGCTAVPETVGRAGVVLEDKAPSLVAAAVHRVIEDNELRAGLVATGIARVDAFSLPASTARLGDAIQAILAADVDSRAAHGLDELR